MPNTITWASSTSGSFNVAANWSPAIVPNANYDAYLGAGSSAYSVASAVTNRVDAAFVGQNVTLAVTAGVFDAYTHLSVSGALSVAAGASLYFGVSTLPSTFYGGLANTGTVTLNATATKGATLKLAGANLDLVGGGSIVLSNSAKNQILGTALSNGVPQVLNNDDETISGAGVVGNAFLELNNRRDGVINASAATALTISTYTASSAYWSANAGTIETTGSGGLTINSSLYQNGLLLADGSGVLKIANGATVQGNGDTEALVSGAQILLSNGSINQGGIVSTVAGSKIVTGAGTTDFLSTPDFENAGQLVISNGSVLKMNLTASNSGLISLSATSAVTKLMVVPDGMALIGTGSLRLSDNANNLITSDGTDDTTLTNFSNTISGSGTIGDAHLRFGNQHDGTVLSNGRVGLTIFGVTDPGSSTDYNSGTIRTTGTGGLTIENTMTNGGLIEASGTGTLDLVNYADPSGAGIIETTTSNASILLDNATIQTGTFSTVAGSVVNTTNGTTNTIENLFLNSGLFNVTNSTLVTGGHVYNYGTMILDGSSTAATLEAGEGGTSGGNLNLLGGGTLILANTVGSSIVSDGYAQRFTNVNDLIEGFGTVGDTNMTLRNERDGTIDADTGSLLTLTSGNQIVNSGLIVSTSTGGIAIQSSIFNNGDISASAGTIKASSGIAGGGDIQISGSGTIEFGGLSTNDAVFAPGSSGTLRIDNSATAGDGLDGYVKGFSGDDVINLNDVNYSASGTTLSYTSKQNEGLLTVTDGTHTASLYFDGAYSLANFTLASDAHGGTDVLFAPGPAAAARAAIRS